MGHQISKAKGAKVTIGQRVAAMILNGLGFIDDCLYMFPQFLENKPVDRLLGTGICTEYFNDDALGRGLDEIYSYGVTRERARNNSAISLRGNGVV